MSKNTSLKDFKNLADTLEKEYKQQGTIAKLYNKLYDMCKSKGETNEECDLNAKQGQLIIAEIWKLRHSSKQNVLNAIVKDVDNTKPLQISKEQKQAIEIVNDINQQHDLYATRLEGKGKQMVQQLYSQSKQLIKDVNKNYNDYYDVWTKLKDLEQSYIKNYEEYNSIKKQYEGKSVPSDVIKKAEQIYNHLTTDIIPKFKELNKKLDELLKQRQEYLNTFYSMYLSLSPQEKQTISIPLTAFDIHKKIYSKIKHDKPKARINKCIQKSWIDAQKEGFNPTFFAPCHIIKQTEVIQNCSSKYDWPYIEYEPNLFAPWDSQNKYSEWINSCSAVESIRRPSIGV